MSLRVADVTKKFGGLVALNSVSIAIARAGIYGIIGPNGSGKTTLFNVITRVIPQDSGSVYYKDKCIDRFGSAKVARLGIARTFQFTRVFRNLTVWDNVLAVTPLRDGQATRKVEEALKMLGLYSSRHQRAGVLPLGQRKLLEFARAIVTEPELILLDEPMGGLGADMIQKTCDHILKLRNMGKTLIVIEHNMSVAMALCEHITVLDHGSVISEGKPEEIREDKRVIEAYLGG